MKQSILVGTYTTGSTSRGIYRLTKGGVALALEACDPSYLLCAPTGLYWVDEALGQREGRLCFASRQGEPVVCLPSGGENPCHLALSPNGRLMAVANYASGSVSLFHLNGHGVPLPAIVFEGSGSGSDPLRQQGPHAHFVHFADDDTLWCCDLGCDAVRVLQCENGVWREATPLFRLPGGSGPRHMVVSDKIAHVLCELDSTLYSLSIASGELLRAVRCVPQRASESAAAIKQGADGRLYTSHRGSDLISVFAPDEKGLPVYVSSFPCGGKSPRDILIVGDQLLCACQDSHTVTMFSIASGSGYTQIGSWSAPSPVCLIAQG